MWSDCSCQTPVQQPSPLCSRPPVNSTPALSYSKVSSRTAFPTLVSTQVSLVMLADASGLLLPPAAVPGLYPHAGRCSGTVSPCRPLFRDCFPVPAAVPGLYPHAGRCSGTASPCRPLFQGCIPVPAAVPGLYPRAGRCSGTASPCQPLLRDSLLKLTSSSITLKQQGRKRREKKKKKEKGEAEQMSSGWSILLCHHLAGRPT
eukprot:g39371.t1